MPARYGKAAPSGKRTAAPKTGVKAAAPRYPKGHPLHKIMTDYDRKRKH
jgi:hypothetical protein